MALMQTPVVHAESKTSSSQEPKPPKPATYDGLRFSTSKTSPVTFLAELEQYMIVSNVPSSRMVIHASSYLRGMALILWQQVPTDGDESVNSWEQFKKWFLARFQPIAASKTARAAIRVLRQKGRPVAAYSEEFFRLVQMIPDMSAADQIENFIAGLTDRAVANEVDRNEKVKDLIAAMEVAQKEELRLQQHNRRFGSRLYSSNFAGARPGSQPAYSTQSQSVPMDLSHMRLSVDQESRYDHGSGDEHESAGDRYEYTANESLQAMSFRPSNRGPNTGGNRGTNRVPGLSREDYSLLSSEGKCFRCRKIGHLARDCPSLPSNGSSKQQGKGRGQ